MRAAGIVLAAGEGRRFGGLKQLAPLDGVPLLLHAVDAMLAVPALDPVVVVLGARAELVAPVLEGRPVTVAVAETWATGPAASLRAATEAVGDVDLAVITLGDQPRITPQVIAAALDHGVGGRAVRTTYDGAPGHPVVLPRRLLGQIPALRPQDGARELLGDAITFEAGHLCDPTDIDTPEDLEALQT